MASGSPTKAYVPYQSKRTSAASINSLGPNASATLQRQLGNSAASSSNTNAVVNNGNGNERGTSAAHVVQQASTSSALPAPTSLSTSLSSSTHGSGLHHPRPNKLNASSNRHQQLDQRGIEFATTATARSPPPPPSSPARIIGTTEGTTSKHTRALSNSGGGRAVIRGGGGGGGVGSSSTSSSNSTANTPRTRSPDPHTFNSSTSTPNRVHSPVSKLVGGSGTSQLHQRTMVQQQHQQEQQQHQGNAGGKAVYHSRFQPQGVRRDRTEEFMNKRKTKGEGKKLDEGRLARRLEKLVALHFPPVDLNDASSEKSAQLGTVNSAAYRVGSALTTLSSLRGKSAKELWSSVSGSRGEIEKAEQAIVKWQEDADAKYCPICMAAFGLKTRRHHCRLCGRVVCFLPPTSSARPPVVDNIGESIKPASITPTRRERCSTFFTYEYQGHSMPSSSGGPSGEKRPIGVIVEVEPVEQDLSFSSVLPELANGGSNMPPTSNPEKKEKDERKKVRVCRDCLNTVLRQQLKTLPIRTPTWLKLYEVLVQLEKEIDHILPEFQELALGLQQTSTRSVQAATSALNLRKRLLTDLASYDTIAKRIRDLPLSVEAAAPGGSQDRLQQAISARATLFLQEKLGLLRSLGDLDDLDGSKAKKRQLKEQNGVGSVKSLASLLGNEALKGADRLMNEKLGAGELEKAEKLKVLLEQEELVRSYVENANATRQFEDAASLQMSLNELQTEIRQLRSTMQ